MALQLVECIPNFSDARRPEVIMDITNVIQSVDGIRILDIHSDLDHNRTVVTYIGAPAAVEEAAFRGIAKAAELIDLEHHNGEHPRIGATDVVPFVPITGVTMTDCIEMARRLGQRVGKVLNIPVYLYEEAATRPECKNLEDIRHGQYEALKTLIRTDPKRVPDFGPLSMTGAGATVIGARQPLIAYNIYLTTDEVSIAEKIARRVRNSSGGLRFVKAMGVLVEGRAQVSMNLTNFKKTPMAQVTEMVRREAERYGVGIHHSELVGLIPEVALVDAARWYLQMDQFESSQVLETRLYEGNSTTQPQAFQGVEESLLDAIASGSPTPGGGSASAHTAAVAAALVAMVGRLTVGKSKYATVEAEMWTLVEKAEELRKKLQIAVNEDAAAFDAIMAARKLPKDTEIQQLERNQAIKQATMHAASVPLNVASDAIQVMQMAVRMTAVANLNAITDAGSAANLAFAAIKSASLNVQVNLLGMENDAQSAELLGQINQILKQAEELLSELRTTLSLRSDLSL
jgi:glutamate formiminotransferase/formiminotetrahydrofolate cyclodeaminase